MIIETDDGSTLNTHMSPFKNENTPPMTPAKAKAIIFKALKDVGLDPYAYTLKARTINFSDLARGSCIFVHIGNWVSNPLWADLKAVAKDNGFCIMGGLLLFLHGEGKGTQLWKSSGPRASQSSPSGKSLRNTHVRRQRRLSAKESSQSTFSRSRNSITSP